MIVNALNCGAKVFMADFEDASSPVWANMIEGQINLQRPLGQRDRLHRHDHRQGLQARAQARRADHPPARLASAGSAISRSTARSPPARWSISASIFFHNAKAALAAGSGPYFYLPKLESHLEARLWNDVFVAAQTALGLKTGTIKATVLIETLPAAFEMDEILYELRDHMAGLNCGRWDYIFSFIKKLARNPAFVLPDRSQVVMTKAFLHAYSLLLIKTCHRRGAFAMGGMAAQIPVKNNPEANAAAFAKVKADKEREAGDGHDGTWVAHPDLVPVAMEVFDRLMPQANQLDKLREDV